MDLDDHHSVYQQLFELSPDPTWIIEDNRFVECNDAAVKTLGYPSRKELLNVHPSKLSPSRQPDGEDSYLKAERMMALAQDRGLHRFDWMHSKASGTHFVAEVTLSTVQLRGRQVIYCVWRDVTEKRQADQLQLALHAISEASHAVDDLPKLMARIHAIVGQLMPARNFFVALHDRIRQEISFPYFIDENDAPPAARQIGQGGLTETVLQTGEALLLTAEALQSGQHSEPLVAGTPSIDWLGVPLKTGTQTVGVLAVQSYSGQLRYTERDMRLLEFVSEQIAMTIQRKQAESASFESAEQLRLVYDTANVAIFNLDLAGIITHANRYMTELFACPLAALIGSEYVAHLHPDERAVARERMRALLSSEIADIDLERPYVRHDGSEFWGHVKGRRRFDAQGQLLGEVAVIVDITERKQHRDQLERMAHFDALTNLPNRTLLADRMQQAMAQAVRRGQRLAVAYLDLDGFKAVNDRHGHNAGDKLLVALANRMKLALREGDTLARLGGDEFAALLIDLTDTAASVPTLTRLLNATAQAVQFDDINLQVSASVGVTFYPQSQNMDADQLLRQADQAMYQAKLAGKNRYHYFDAEQDHDIRGHHESVEHIRLAFERRQFVLHYQPKVNLRTGKIIGAEALIRWQHPERGLLAPALFLPVIEGHPLSADVGEWVIDAALSQIEDWRPLGLDLSVSVNVGARQLQQRDFVSRLCTILATHPTVNPASLELEILETTALEDVAQISQVIEACNDLGVGFALDDFGTGYSSLTYLKRLRVGTIKIDQSFVRDMLNDPDDLAILQSVIGLAGNLKRKVIAEGMETPEQGTMLLQLGCNLAQGYGIARPMPAGEMPVWAACWRPDPGWQQLPWIIGT